MASTHEYHSTLPAVAPVAGCAYYLRAGLTALITDAVTIEGVVFLVGYIIEDGGNGKTLWHSSGQYSPVRFAKHELDIIWEMA